MKHPCRFLFSLTLLMTLYAFAAPAQAPVGSDSSLRETLTRAVQYWQGGKAKDAFLSLDSITSAGLNEANAVTKIKAALWTATYLQEQKKIKPASRFLDSALTWSERYHASDELIRSYEAYAAWHLNAGNPKTAMVAREAAWKLKDSLSNAA
ncbi:MAG: hypothetical protein JNL88_02385, partial [Bacteroidia bacterium]|nr:hypothetical protein [Bacteroidia bacterium]